MYVFWRVKLIALTHKTSKLIVGRRNDFKYITKLMYFAQLYPFRLDFLIKSCKTMIGAKLSRPVFSNSLVWYVYVHNPRAWKNGNKKYFIK